MNLVISPSLEDALIGQMLGLDPDQMKFLRAIQGQAVVLSASPAERETKDFQELHVALNEMAQRGFIASLEIIERGSGS